MNKIIASSALCASVLMLGACATPKKTDSDAEFRQETQRHYDPEAHQWEQSPPYGKQSNESDQGQQ